MAILIAIVQYWRSSAVYTADAVIFLPKISSWKAWDIWYVNEWNAIAYRHQHEQSRKAELFEIAATKLARIGTASESTLGITKELIATVEIGRHKDWDESNPNGSIVFRASGSTLENATLKATAMLSAFQSLVSKSSASMLDAEYRERLANLKAKPDPERFPPEKLPYEFVTGLTEQEFYKQLSFERIKQMEPMSFPPSRERTHMVTVSRNDRLLSWGLAIWVASGTAIVWQRKANQSAV